MAIEEAAAAGPPLEVQFSIRGTLSTSLAVFGRNLPPFLIISAVVSLPYFALQTWLDYLEAQGEIDPDSAFGSSGLVMIGVQTITFGVLQAVLTYGTIQDLRGQRGGIGDSFRGGFAHLGEVLSGALIYGLLLGLATMLLIIPGVVLYLRWWVFMPAMVIEKLKTGASFDRSAKLTAGRRWAILGLATVVFATQLLLVIAGVLLLPIDSFLAAILVTLIVVLFSTFSSVVAAVGYYHLRAEKEGVIIDDIAKVFD